jgi:hypothetical protein
VVQVLDHRDIKEIVLSSLDPAGGLVISVSADAQRLLTLNIHSGQPAHGPLRPVRTEAHIRTNGVDTFVLDLDGFEYRDIDWQPEGQSQILTLLTRLAQAYLAGGGRQDEKSGLIGRRYGRLTVELDGVSYPFRGKRL